jgi:hypothetical protein
MDEETRNKLIDLISKAENVKEIPLLMAQMFMGDTMSGMMEMQQMMMKIAGVISGITEKFSDINNADV